LRWLLAGAIIFPLAGAFLAWDQGPLLVRDFSLGENLLPAKRFHLVNGRCRSRLVLYSCEIKASASSGGGAREMELKYMFADLPFAQYSVRLLEKISDPAVLTTDLGQQKLLNRAVTLLALLLFCFSAPFFYLRARRRSKLALQNNL
jgi:hypothetical protein